MALKAITVNTPAEQEAHILAQDDAAIYQSIVGSDGIFNIGNKFAASILSNNSVRVSDGVLCVGGHIARTAYADYQDMVIENGASGQNRNDIIVAKFQTSGSVDTLTLEVKKGTPGSAATDPALTQNNLYQGGTVREYPLWRVKLEGLSITDVEQMYTEIPTIPELLAKIDELNTNLSNLEDTILAASDTTFTFSSDTVFTTYGVQRIIKSGKTVSIYLHYQVNNALTSSAYFGNIPAGYRPYKQITGISPINVQSGSRGTVKIETNGNITATTTFATGVYVLIFTFPAA